MDAVLTFEVCCKLHSFSDSYQVKHRETNLISCVIF